MDWEWGFSHFPFERNYFFFWGSGGRFPQYGTLTGTIFHFSNKNERGILFVKTFTVNIRHKTGNVRSADTDLSLSLSQLYFIDDLSTAYAVAFQRQDGEVEMLWRDVLLTCYKTLEGLNKEPVQLLCSRSLGCRSDS